MSSGGKGAVQSPEGCAAAFPSVQAEDLENDQLNRILELLEKGQKGLKAHLDKLTLADLEACVSKLNLDSEASIKEYLSFMKISETLGVCSKCEWKSGCVACSYEAAMKYAIKERKVPYWWARKTGQAFQKRLFRRRGSRIS